VRILVIHNYYEHPGGEDRVFESEVQMLRDHGHTVVTHTQRNDQIRRNDRLGLAIDTIWSRRSQAALARVLAQFRPDIAHFHNTLPLVSPSAYFACQAAGVPVVQTIHNYRLGCPKATHFRADSLCEQCVGKALPWPGIVHACYRGSRSTTAVVAGMLGVHRALGTWRNKIDVYIAVSEFVRRKLVQSGVPSQKIIVKGNFLNVDPGHGQHNGGFFLFVGRLTPEKGIRLLISAWKQLEESLPLKIVGDGPLAAWVRDETRQQPNIELLGWRTPPEVLELMGAARAVTVPSQWYEPFGLSVIEAFAKGTPVIAAGAGALSEIVDHERTGLLHVADDPADLAAQVLWASQHPWSMKSYGRRARCEYEKRYTAEVNYEQLMQIYARARGTRVSPTPKVSA